MANPLDPEINQNVVSGLDNKAVLAAIDVMHANYDTKIIKDGENQLIQKMFQDGFKISDPTGMHQISSQLLQQAFWRTINRVKFLDFALHGTGQDENKEKVVTDGVSTVLERCGLTRCLRDKDGVLTKSVMYGDGMLMIGVDPDGDQDFPIQFNPISNSNIYVDSYATGVRSGGLGRSATKMVVVFSYSWADFCEMYPDFAKKAGIGKIPRDIGLLKELERTYVQTTKLQDLIEVAHYYDIVNERYVCFAGPNCTVLEEYGAKKQKPYPFVKDGEPYIPVIQFICYPSFDGFWNFGLGNMLYKLARVCERLMNMQINHINDNTYPIVLVNTPQGEAAKFFNKMSLAYEMRAVGKKGFVSMEYDPSNPNSGKVSAESLTTQNLFQEWQATWEALTREIKRLGINLDDIDIAGNPNQMQLMTEENRSTAFVEQMGEFNASESEFLIELTLDFIKKFVSKNNKTKLNLTTTIDSNGQKVRMDQITLGGLADELKKNHWFVKVNARTGSIPSNIMKQTQLQRALAIMPPGSKAWADTAAAFAGINDMDIKASDLMPPQAPQQGQGSPQGGQPPQMPQVPQEGNLMPAMAR